VLICSKEATSILFADPSKSNHSQISLRPSQVNQLLAEIAKSLFTHRKKPSKSPALLSDAQGNVICIAIAAPRQAEYESPTSVALRFISQHKKLAELNSSGTRLHILRDQTGKVDSMGDIYNFSPLQVFIGPACADVCNVTSDLSRLDFWTDARAKRGMNSQEILDLESHNLTEANLKEYFSGYRSDLPPLMPSLLASQVFKRWSKTRIAANDKELLSELMRDLHILAEQNVLNMGGPFAAAVISPEGIVTGLGENQVIRGSDASSHGERVALWSAQQHLGSAELKGYTVVTSSFPCLGCSEACARAGLLQIFYGNSRDEVQQLTPFTEGPLDFNRLGALDLSLAQVKMPSEIAHAAFKRFNANLLLNPELGYLGDLELK